MYKMAPTVKKHGRDNSASIQLIGGGSLWAGDECRNAGVANPRGLVSALPAYICHKENTIRLAGWARSSRHAKPSNLRFQIRDHGQICNTILSNQLALLDETTVFAHDHPYGIVDYVYASLTSPGILTLSIGNVKLM